MRKVIGASLLVLAVWVGVEVYHEGVDGAFGGYFAEGFGTKMSKFDAPADHSTSRRTVDAFQRAYDRSEQRVDQLLGQRGAEE